MTKSTLVAFFATVNQLQIPFTDYLNPEIDHSDFVSQLKDYYGIDEIPEELQELYFLHNGVDIDRAVAKSDERYAHTIPDYYLCSLSEALDYLNTDETYQMKRRNLFPVLANGDGEFLAIQLVGEQKGVIFLCSNQFITEGVDLITSNYDSLERMFQTFIKFHVEKAISLDDEKFLEFDFSRKFKLGRMLNPNSDFFKE